jgi:hypothetical protein
MKHVSQRDGGWGEKMQTGQYRNRLIFAWLDYCNNPWVEGGLLVIVALMFLARMPTAVKQAHEIAQELEWEEVVGKGEAAPQADADANEGSSKKED